MSAYSPLPGEAQALLPKLTVAQTRAVLNGKIGNGFDRGRGFWPLYHALVGKGLFCSADRKPALTPLGREAQALLKALA